MMGEFYHKGHYLPHFHKGRKIHFITYRLADSLPQHILEQFRIEIQIFPEAKKKMFFDKKVGEWLDRDIGDCFLRKKEIAQLIVDVWKFYDKQDYILLSWVVMSNHVHVLIEVKNSSLVGKIIQRWKSYTAIQINKLFSKTGTVWANEYYDRYIRDKEHLINTIAYIKSNIRKGGILWDVPNSIEELEEKILGKN